VAAGELGQRAAGLGEADLGAGADGQVREGLRDVCFPDPDRYPRVLSSSLLCL